MRSAEWSNLDPASTTEIDVEDELKPIRIRMLDGNVPVARSGHSMAYDKNSNMIMVFGGSANSGIDGDMNDLWEYDIKENAWRNV